MHHRWSQISIILGILLFSGCFEPPEFSNTPYIEFASLKYYQYAADDDSLILKFDFEDGDGDIGLGDRHVGYPFHRLDTVVDSRGVIVTISDPNVVPPFYLLNRRQKTFFSETDNRPSYNKCDYYIANEFNDTVYVQINEYNNNFHLDILKRKNGVYSKFFFGDSNCDLVDFDSRIPEFDPEHEGRSLSGTISYHMQSLGWENVLTPDTFKLRFYIFDRALNKSNEVESPEFLFQDIIVAR